MKYTSSVWLPADVEVAKFWKAGMKGSLASVATLFPSWEQSKTKLFLLIGPSTGIT